MTQRRQMVRPEQKRSFVSASLVSALGMGGTTTRKIDHTHTHRHIPVVPGEMVGWLALGVVPTGMRLSLVPKKNTGDKEHSFSRLDFSLVVV